ncbi:MAG: sigma 54-interacting transcriptional regulator [Deltaproteobacteria bacterium]|nr:sigma 54-interacting transcriptional regulator [Deltaproteobacteria bacterium]
MQDKPYQIGVLVSSMPLIEKIQELAKKEGHIIHSSRAAFEEAVADGKKMEASGVEVIISRRGLAQMLRTNLRIPVLSIPYASVDALKSLKQASELGRKILLASFMEKIDRIEVIAEFLNVEIKQFVYADIASLDEGLRSAESQGYEVVVGGRWTMRTAEKLRTMKYVQLRSIDIDEDIAATIESATSVAQVNREEKKRTYRYQCIIDATTEGIIAVDNKGRVNAINKAAKNFMNITAANIMGQPISSFINSPSVLDFLNAKAPIWNKLEKINDEMFVFNHLPVEMSKEIIGGVSTFKDVNNVMVAENAVRQSLTKGFVAKYSIADLVHADPAMRNVVTKARQFAKTDSTILLVGATGTGKEILAQSIHNLSPRAENPFVSLHCGALPESLLESELFGYEEGAFTGSKKRGSAGRFEMAHTGTLFLDEIDTTPLNVQTRLLRVLQEKEVMRLGGGHKIPVNIRIIAAAGRDLASALQEGRFREDLFFRLNVLRINIPPLKDRAKDIPVLLKHYIGQLSAKNGLEPISLPSAYVQKLMAYSWPGNVRQLRNFVECLVLNSHLRSHTTPLEELYEEFYEELMQYGPENKIAESVKEAKSIKKGMKERKRDQESIIIWEALEEAKFNKTRAAKALGITRTTLWRKMKEAGYDLLPQDSANRQEN